MIFSSQAVVDEMEKISGFFGLLKLNPRSDELDRAFAAYEKTTKRDKSTMSFGDIEHWVSKTRGMKKHAAAPSVLSHVLAGLDPTNTYSFELAQKAEQQPKENKKHLRRALLTTALAAGTGALLIPKATRALMGAHVGLTHGGISKIPLGIKAGLSVPNTAWDHVAGSVVGAGGAGLAYYHGIRAEKKFKQRLQEALDGRSKS